MLLYRNGFFSIVNYLSHPNSTWSFHKEIPVGIDLTCIKKRSRIKYLFQQRALYNGSIDCAKQILKNEGFMSMMKGAGANVLRGVAGAGVLAGADKMKELYISLRTK